jgi:hypothetical protein
MLVPQVRHQLHRVAVENHGFLAVFADVGGHHVRFHRGQRVQAKVFGDLT